MAEEKENTEKTEKTEKAEKAEEKEKKEAPKKEKAAGKKVRLTKEEVISFIEEMSVLELAELVKALEEKFGVSAAAPVIAAQPIGTEAASEEEKEEQTTFNVILAAVGSSKIQVIKTVREIVPSLGLKDAKDLVDAAPKPVKEGVSKEEAGEIKKKLETAGATVELK